MAFQNTGDDHRTQFTCGLAAQQLYEKRFSYAGLCLTMQVTGTLCYHTFIGALYPLPYM